MLRLLSILSRFRNLILWLVLQLFAISLIVRMNDHQRHIFGNIMLEVSGDLHSQRYSFNRFLNLPAQNDSLIVQNRRLIQRNDSLRKRIQDYEARLLLTTTENPGLADGYEMDQGYRLIPCRAIHTSLNKSYNYIYLDKGSKDGVYENMGVISPQGIAGKVIRVSKNYSLALSAINLSFKLSAKLQGQDIPGVYEWEIDDPYHGYIDKVRTDATIEDNMKVVTSNVSTNFPEGYLVGTIRAADQKLEGSYYRLRMELATNFSQLNNLYLLEAVSKNELDSLSSGFIKE